MTDSLIDKYHRSSSVYLATSQDVETTSIWVPDFNIVNNIDGLQEFPESKANVYADGTVVWALSGELKVS